MRERETDTKETRTVKAHAPLASKAENVDDDGEFAVASQEERYWRKNFAMRPYVSVGSAYEQYGPAFQYGWESYRRHPGKRFDEVESELGRLWDSVKGKSKLGWNLAKHAVRDAWERLARHD